MKAFLFLISLAVCAFPASVAARQGNSCWGEATAVFARTGVMGEHASQQTEPRLGLANLARALYEAGVLQQPTLADLGAYVAGELGLQLDRCMENQAAVIAAESAAASNAACWGQASALFAQTGVMGQHASQQSSPRLGLRNLARALYEAGVIPDDGMATLGTYVAEGLGLEIDACM